MTTRQKKSERGFVLITMTAAAIAMIGALGLAVDMGHVYIVKNETQTFADAAALAAALQLNGLDTGITAANAAVTTMKSSDKWNFGTTSVGTPTVEYTTSTAGATASNACTGTWTNAPPSPPTSYNCVRVKTSVSVPIFFLPMVMSSAAYTTTVNSTAIAGQIDVTTLGTGLSPYSGVSTDTTPPKFGLTVGGEYAIQWPHFSGGGGCDAQHPDKCFNSATCADDSDAAKWAVASNWSSAFNGYWGATSNSAIESYILAYAQLQAVSVNDNLAPVLTSGQKNSEGGWLDWRVNHDTDSIDDTWATYKTALANGTANGERLLNVPVLDPTSSTVTTVLGYGQYLLHTNAKVTGGSLTPSNFYTKRNGNEAWCAIYAGPIDLGSITPGVGGSSGAARVQLIQ